jgi:lysophospholipase L1-like esterase
MVKNFRIESFKSMVTIGDSITFGMCASPKEFCWADRLASEISLCQGQDILLSNVGISSNLLSRRSPAYDHSSKPCGIERFEKDVIKHGADLVIIAYGLNDVRGGTPVDIFIEDLDFIVKEIKKRTNAVIALVNIYFMTNFDFSPGIWDKGSIESIRLYNQRIMELSLYNDVLYADIYSAMNEANFAVSHDGIHPNNLGHRLISNKIFEIIATHCSCPANF